MLHASGHPRELLRTSLSFSNGAWGRERAHLMLSGEMNNPRSALDSHLHTHMVVVQAHKDTAPSVLPHPLHTSHKQATAHASLSQGAPPTMPCSA